jgi:Glyoxalase-like domain
MSLVLDHVFICCEPEGPEADALLSSGVVEGTRNVHPGQGTANRRFFFHGGFIELLWVHSQEEAQSELTAPTRLWNRWQARKSGGCPFGIAFSTAGEEVAKVPFTAWPYRPVYLPETKSILFAEGTSLLEPELFYMAWANPQASSANQPKDHRNGIKRLISASVGMPLDTPLSEASRALRSAGLLSFHVAEQYELRLSLEGNEPKVLDFRQTLPLVLEVSQAYPDSAVT